MTSVSSSPFCAKTEHHQYLSFNKSCIPPPLTLFAFSRFVFFSPRIALSGYLQPRGEAQLYHSKAWFLHAAEEKESKQKPTVVVPCTILSSEPLRYT
jgi:hypothetical protein